MKSSSDWFGLALLVGVGGFLLWCLYRIAINTAAILTYVATRP